MTPSETGSGASPSAVTISRVGFEHYREAFGIGTTRPRLSWIVATERTGWRQAGYEIETYGADSRLRDQSGHIASDQSVLVDWPFAPLVARERLQVRVRSRGTDNEPSEWSALYPVEAGLLLAADWSARFVTPPWEEDTSTAQPAPLLRREFQPRAGVRQARLYASALGVFEARINGQVVGDHVLDPGWTSYHHRLRYQTFDVTDMLQEGPNVIGALLGDGWYRGRLGFGGGQRNIYGDRLALLAQLEISYTDGTSERIVTDDSWRAIRGPIVSSDIYDGETYDARLEQPGWAEIGYDDGDWSGVKTIDRDLATLVAPVGPPVRRIEEIAPRTITTAPSGATIIDFGQNLVGWLRLTVEGAAGQTITLRHAEVLEDGELSTRPLRHAEATDRYTLRGEGRETWEPRFTFHGFRYAEVTGWPGELKAADLVAVVVHSDLERTGWFSCSDPLINRLHENVLWSMHGNFLDIPTDCPQRDERLGWTGDIQVFAPTACFLGDSAGFLASWLADLAVEQQDQQGVVPFVVPTVMSEVNPPAAAWGDAATVVPWVLYQRYGDSAILEQQFASMRAWVDCLAAIAGPQHLWDRGFQFGDWLDPSAPPDNPAAARTDPHLVATAYFARSADLVAQAAEVLGRTEEQAHYRALAAEVRTAFAREYITPAGRLLSDAATGYALGIEFGLFPDPVQRRHAAKRLVDILRMGDYHISTGFVGTPLICDALCSVGEYRAAFRLLLQRDNPSWLYPVTMGATTIWERWDSMLPDGSVNPGEMTSFNHYALGAVADWMHRTIGGLAPAAPGYRSLEIRPRPGGGITQASARHHTPYGMAECTWSIEAETFQLTVVVPANATARVTLPGSDDAPIEVGSGTHHWSCAYHDPDARPKLTIDSTVGELVDDAAAWTAVLHVFDHLSSDRPFLKPMVQSQSSVPLQQVLATVSNADEVRSAVAEALAALA